MSDKLPKGHPFEIWMSALPRASLLIPDDIIAGNSRRFIFFYRGEYGMHRAKNLQSQIVPEAMKVSLVDFMALRTEPGVTLIFVFHGIEESSPSEYPDDHPDAWGDETRIVVSNVSSFRETAEERIARIHGEVMNVPVIVKSEPLPGLREAIVY